MRTSKNYVPDTQLSDSRNYLPDLTIPETQVDENCPVHDTQAFLQQTEGFEINSEDPLLNKEENEAQKQPIIVKPEDLSASSNGSTEEMAESNEDLTQQTPASEKRNSSEDLTKQSPPSSEDHPSSEDVTQKAPASEDPACSKNFSEETLASEKRNSSEDLTKQTHASEDNPSSEDLTQDLAASENRPSSEDLTPNTPASEERTSNQNLTEETAASEDCPPSENISSEMAEPLSNVMNKQPSDIDETPRVETDRLPIVNYTSSDSLSEVGKSSYMLIIYQEVLMKFI